MNRCTYFIMDKKRFLKKEVRKLNILKNQKQKRQH